MVHPRSETADSPMRFLCGCRTLSVKVSRPQRAYGGGGLVALGGAPRCAYRDSSEQAPKIRLRQTSVHSVGVGVDHS